MVTKLLLRLFLRRMRIITISTIIFFLIPSAPVPAQQWEWQNPKPQGDGINQIHFLDELHGWMLPFSRNLLRTRDGGSTWTVHALGLTLIKVIFVSPEKGWAIGQHDAFGFDYGIYKTTDGGMSWTVSVPETLRTFNRAVLRLTFSDARHGWHVSDGIRNGLDVGMLRTTDGGMTWHVITEGQRRPSGIAFRDSLNGVINTSQYFSRTTDGGLNWVRDSTLGSYPQIKFVDTLYGWAARPRGTFTPSIIRTTDGGVSWHERNNSIEGEFFPLSPAVCFLLNDSGLYKTIDSATTWQQLTVNDFQDVGFGVLPTYFFTTENDGWAAASYTVFRTQDSGVNWERQDRNALGQGYVNVWGIDFINNDTGWTAGSAFYRSAFVHNLVAKTTDGGKNWQLLNTQIPSRPRRLKFVNSQTGWLIGSDGMIMKTTNGGTSWVSQQSSTTQQLWDLSFWDENNGVVVGEGVILKSTNGGAHWNSIDFGQPVMLDDVQFVDSLYGWAAGARFLRTTDGGGTWETIPAQPGLRAIGRCYFFDRARGWLVVSSDDQSLYIIAETTESGYTWTERFRREPNENLGLHRGGIVFLDSLNGAAIGGFGTIIRTSDGGASWQDETGFTTRMMNEITSVRDHGLWIAGDNGAVIRLTKNPPTSVSAEGMSISNDQTLVLFPSYPNPFNAMSTIRFRLSKEEEVVVEVFDVLGRKMKQMELGRRLPGEHSVTLTLDGFSSGVYLYTVRAGASVKVRKALLIK